MTTEILDVALWGALIRVKAAITNLGHDDERYTLELRAVDRQPWVTVHARAVYQLDDYPPDYDFAIWRRTGALHLMVDGEVQDPELEV